MLSMLAKDLLSIGMALVLLLLSSCSESRKWAGGRSSSVRDSAGVEIVESREPIWASQPGWSLSSEPTLVVGPAVGSDRFLYRVGDVERLEVGRLIVENRGSGELFVFDSTGLFLDAWGGEGEGPGEFRSMLRLFRCTDGRLVEFESHRMTFLDSDGRLLQTTGLPPEVAGHQKEVRGVGEDCQATFFTGLVPRYDPTGIGTHHYPVQAFWVSLATPRIDTLGTFLGPEWVADRSGRPAFLLPFAFTANWASDGRSVYYGWGDQPQVTVFSPDGEMLRIIRWGAPPNSTTEADWESYEADVQEERITDPRGAALYLPREDHPRPNLKPHYGPQDAFGSAFLIGDEGFLWVRQFTRSLARDRESPMPPVHWWIFDRTGRWLGEVETPEGFEARNVRGDLVLGVSRNALGVEQVQGYRLSRRPN